MQIQDQNTDFEVRSLDNEAKSYNDHDVRWHQFIKYGLAGMFFGIILVKSEAISWFRIQAMFRLQSFHMYGLIGSAVLTGLISVQLIRLFGVKTIQNEDVKVHHKRFSFGQVIGGLIFGLGWAMTGACPGPIYALIGSGATVFIVVLLSALAGTYVYGKFKGRLLH
jgi:uncharacterized membrane protein YedE/YeeE